MSNYFITLEQSPYLFNYFLAKVLNERFYLKGDEEAGDQTSRASRITPILSYVSVFTYIAAVLCPAIFIGRTYAIILDIGSSTD